jgi:hypothetical protein
MPPVYRPPADPRLQAAAAEVDDMPVTNWEPPPDPSERDRIAGTAQTDQSRNVDAAVGSADTDPDRTYRDPPDEPINMHGSER